ncbi:hypothetical protein N7520_000990 [Penicillium odoratum]|uniref:uncharacterized protein n=1 Tax=Penicillium odoratum TaxID=1167516 RepID=UPI00254729BC|nr:uncharacterized protein N7520_000990 [Penicillium odoratum]KAJ5777744.1 hypothetical protein N7520_000990 [Penicillium odoratum]
MELSEHNGFKDTKAVIEQIKAIESPINQTTISEASSATRTPWQDRLAELAHLASAFLSPDNRDINADLLIHEHLDAIEAILRGPQAELSQEVACEGRRRSFRTRSLLGDRDASELKEPDWLAKSRFDEQKRKETSAQLTTLLEEITALNQELHQRHAESVEIREVYEDRCRGLARTVAELEDEVSELRSDLVEDAVELEGIQGTVRGLQNWIQGMQEEQNKIRAIRDLRRKAKRGWGRKRNDEGEAEGEIVLDGLNAWMRGWKDVEDGFQVRARGRRARREERQRQLLRLDNVQYKSV